ncbi:electron transporter [Streptomyces abyssalis]|uniref:Electron transporter n=1 Tax=Streptomyces abyssalis TaxID=933944 RepID=A0A1E7JQ17_9ACTN|nr:DM13 domain-containing protein [Streptomyces abyssalis]OEU90368.1 electron transporter [Streptomyces abyssalis]OEU95105.1 electron transporter [Streptomyces abyssalis]
MRRASRWVRKPLYAGVLVVGLVALAVGLYLFQPWKLWTDEKVDEALPGAAVSGKPDGPAEPEKPGESAAPGKGGKPAGPTTLASGEFITHEHETTGSAKVVELQDGSRVLRLQDLNTSNGPDLKVWITDAKVKPGTAGWHVFDDGAHLSLGELKGNKGSQNYTLPAGADLDEYSSVTIWCDRFDVSFGAAELSRA